MVAGYVRAVERTTPVTAAQRTLEVRLPTRHEEFRRRAGFTITNLARSADVSRPYVSRIEAGKIPASKRYREAFSELCQVPEAWVFDGAGRVLS